MQRRLRQRRGQSGFTLVELLVVIVILGILSAVVVFAVRRSNDNSRAAAVATDTRIVRTALEVYCAEKGSYPADPPPDAAGVDKDAMDVLVEEKFLGNRSEYNSLSTGDGPADRFPLGVCPGSPQHYNLTPQGPCPGSPGVTPGRWANAPAPLKGVTPDHPRNMVQLPDGRIFTGAEVFAPAACSDGTWTLAAENLYGQKHLNRMPDGNVCYYGEGFLCAFDPPSAMVVIAGNRCGDSCGKVLTYISGGAYKYIGRGSQRELDGEWELYDPLAAPGAERIGRWTMVRENPGAYNPTQLPQGPADNVRAVQILGTTEECGLSCGKVLMVNSPTEGAAELFDPSTGIFLPVGTFGPDTTTSSTVYARTNPLLERLPRGQVLFINGPRASVFDPLSGRLLPVPPPPSPHSGSMDETAVLPGGKVMVTSNVASIYRDRPNQVETFKPEATGVGGSWEVTGTCGEVTSATDPYWYERQCHLLSALPGGRILAYTAYSNFAYFRGTPYKGRTYELNPNNMGWSRQGDMNNRVEDYRNGPTGALFISAGAIFISGGTCRACNKVLAVNYSRPTYPPYGNYDSRPTATPEPALAAQLYTPALP